MALSDVLSLKNRQPSVLFKAWLKGRSPMGDNAFDKRIPIIPESVGKNLDPLIPKAGDIMTSWNGLCFTEGKYVYAYVRKDSDDQVCMDFYFVRNPVLKDCIFRATVKDGFRLDPYKENIFRRLLHQYIGWIGSNKEQFLRELKKSMKIPENVDSMSVGDLLDYLYALFAGKRVKKALYDAGYYYLASHIDYIIGIDEAGESAEEILGLPEPFVKLYDECSTHLETWIYPGKREEANELYKRFATYIGDIPPTLRQYKYLEEIDDFGGEFDKDIYNKIAVLDHKGDYKQEMLNISDSYERIKRFCQLRSKEGGICKIDCIPTEEEFDNVMEVLETADDYHGSEEYVIWKLVDLYDDKYHFSDEKYSIVFPLDLSSFLNEELVLKNKVLSLLYGVMLGEDIVLFIHKTATDEPYGYIDITENSIFDVCMKGDKAPNKKVIDFVNRFAAAKGLRYDVKAHGSNDHT